MKKVLKNIALSLITIVVGFYSVAIPFNLFDQLSDHAMRVFFWSEVLIFFVIAMITLVIMDVKKAKKTKAKLRYERHLKQVKEVEESWLKFAA